MDIARYTRRNTLPHWQHVAAWQFGRELAELPAVEHGHLPQPVPGTHPHGHVPRKAARQVQEVLRHPDTRLGPHHAHRYMGGLFAENVCAMAGAVHEVLVQTFHGLPFQIPAPPDNLDHGNIFS